MLRHLMLERVILALLMIVSATACYPTGGPELVTLTSLGPAAVSRGERVTLNGSGFPEGKPAEITFTGTLYRPGAPPRAIQQRVHGRSTGSEVIEWIADEQFIAALCDNDAEHATFHGDARVWFDAVSSSAPRVTGVLRATTLDVYRVPPRREADANRAAERRILAFLGVTDWTATAPGLKLKALSAESELLTAGLANGDVLLEANRVRLFEPRDLLPARSARVLNLQFARPPSREVFDVSLDLDAYQPRSPEELAPLAAIAGFAVAMLFAFTGPFGRAIGWFERTARSRLDAAPARKRTLGALLQTILPSAFATRTTYSASFIAFSAVGALFTAVSLDMPIVGGLDIPVLFGFGAVCLVTGKVVSGGARASGWSLRGGLGAGLRSLLQVACAGLAVGGGAAVPSALSLVQIVSAQGGWPWNFAGFVNPGLFVLCFVALATAVPDASSGAADWIEMQDTSRPRQPFSGLLRLAAVWGDRFYVFMTCALIVTVFLGGWRLPELGTGRTSLVSELSGAALFQLKFTFTAAVVFALRELAARAPIELLTDMALKRLVPIAFLSLLSALAYQRWQFTEAHAWASDLTGPVLVTSCAVCSAAIAVRLRRTLTEPSAGYTVNPWL